MELATMELSRTDNNYYPFGIPADHESGGWFHVPGETATRLIHLQESMGYLHRIADDAISAVRKAERNLASLRHASDTATNWLATAKQELEEITETL